MQEEEIRAIRDYKVIGEYDLDLDKLIQSV